MKTLVVLGLTVLQNAVPVQPPQSPLPQGAPVPAVPEEPPAAPSVPPYEGGFVRGMRELRQHARAGEYEQALALADGLLAAEPGGSWRTSVENATGGWSEGVLAQFEGPLEWLGVETRTSADRAEVHYARGFVLHELARREESRESFGKARVLAGPGPTRLDAVYDLGTSALLEGEEWRAKIPEISGAQTPPAPGPAVPPAGSGSPIPGAQPPAPEDPLPRAKAAYLEAREHLVERLRSDWQDADSRANAELVMRRLREIEKIEKQREEEQKQQQQQQPQDQKKDPQQNQGQDKPQGDQQKQEKPEDQKPDEQKDKPPEEKKDESKPEDASKDDSSKNEPPKDPASKPEEHQLTKEEVQRLLDKLAEHEKEGEEVHERLQRLRRVPVKRDW
jgi:hypothetical protein